MWYCRLIKNLLTNIFDISQTLSDWHLFGAVMCFVGIDLVIILTFIVIQGFRDHLVANLSPNAELPREFVGVSHVT